MEHYSYHKHFKTDTCNTVQWGKLFKWVGTSYGDITTIEEYSKLMVGTVCHSYAIDVWVGVARGFYDPRHSVLFVNNIIKQGMQNRCQTLFHQRHTTLGLLLTRLPSARAHWACLSIALGITL